MKMLELTRLLSFTTDNSEAKSTLVKALKDKLIVSD